ncbi:MAG TPA: sigma-70 family RNA polymerase sigma factor [Polyangiaceae bacterium]|nr:sigma-70 family RNA polymerase sigma factor [Polyangiaceae bacterium]
MLVSKVLLSRNPFSKLIRHVPPSSEPVRAGAHARLEAAARENFQFIWRCLRRFGVRPEHAVDDAAQRVFEVAARKCEQIEVGRERAFLFKTAVWVAAEVRRAQRRDEYVDLDELHGEHLVAASPAPEQAAIDRELRHCLDEVLGAMPDELRTVFVLFELEHLPAGDIAELVGIPVGTVASRLRRARQDFHARARRWRAKFEFFAGGARENQR